MPRRLPGLAALRTFEAAARHLSCTRAADELAVTPAAVSAQVRALEQQLGVRLFLRTGRALRLTGEGEVLVAAVGEALDGIARAVDRIVDRRQRPQLAVHVALSIATKWLVPRLGRFYRLHPQVDVRLNVTDRLPDLARGEADAAIQFGAGAYPGLRA